tara:strand:- start:2794 stop:3570 length:777 start_codon:yes stop_codon:yes gene_type:complete
MPTTTNLSLTLPDPGSESSRGTWGTTLNTAITAIDTALADASSSAAGRMSSSDKTKLDAIEANAKADQTGAEIKSLYEGESDTNAFTDALLSKLNGIEASATADQTGAQIKTAYEAESDTNAFTDTLLSKLNAVEASADVTDATNVNAAGAFMHTDIPDSDTGFLKRTGSETYDVDTSTYITGNQTITVSGDVTGSGTTGITATLAASGVTAATYGSATQVPVLAVDAKGRVTSVTNTTITSSGVSEDTVVALALALG